MTCACGFQLNSDVKFCPNCGAPAKPLAQSIPAATCPHCGGAVSSNSPFCVNCGTPLKAAQTTVASAPPAAPTSCPVCSNPVEAGKPFCASCGAHLTGAPASAPAAASCPSCGQPTNANAPFCMSCGTRLSSGTPAGQNAVRPTQCQQCGWPLNAGAAFCPHCGAHYGPVVGGVMGVQTAQAVQAPYQSAGFNQAVSQVGQVHTCPRCGGAVPGDMQFCAHCGQSMAGIQPPQGVFGQAGQVFSTILGSNAGKVGLGALGGVAATLAAEEGVKLFEEKIKGDVEHDEGYHRRHHHHNEW